MIKIVFFFMISQNDRMTNNKELGIVLLFHLLLGEKTIRIR